MNKNQETYKNRERGQSLVELAMSLVILLTLLAGLVDLGRAFFTYIALRDAAQEGASFASVIITEPIDGINQIDRIDTVDEFCTAITDRVLITTKDLNGGISSGPINLEALAAAGEISVQTQIRNYECASVPASEVCLGGAVNVKVEYSSFPLTMPFIGTIIGSQSIPLSAEVIDTILTPACE